MRLGDLDALRQEIERIYQKHFAKSREKFVQDTFKAMFKRIDNALTIDAVPVVRCKDCKKRGKKKCPLVTVRFDVKTNGTIREVLEQNYVDEDFWCKDGERKDDNG